MKSAQSAALILAVLLMTPAFGLDGWSSGRITDIRIQQDQVLIKQEGALNPGGCRSAEYLVLPLGLGVNDDLGLRLMVSFLPSVMLMGNEVEFGLEGCGPYPVIQEMNMNDGRGR